MDYCSSCRRHLNGALVCPGCGSYAPDIAPPTVGTRPMPAWGATSPTTRYAPDTTYAGASQAPGIWHDGPLRGEAELGADTADTADTRVGASTDVEGMPPAQQGRAARRRQLARWKKNKRRAVVATAVAFAGGALTISSMDRHTADRAQANTVPDDRSMGTAEKQTSEITYPASTPPTTHRSPHTAPKAQRPAANTPREQILAAAPRTTDPVARPDAAAPPRQPAKSVPQPLTTTSPEVDRAATTAEQTPTPAASDPTNSSPPQASPAPASTSPTQICLLVLCLG
ncbi:hypothetical protein AB0I77_03250 [Streptomyces sp. NPDC050619]|uniref:SCO2400 family protein n=1 Tax=Streptomyces sp. NPDC050619 TaxID=3157214 RepID=UPI0034228CAA